MRRRKIVGVMGSGSRGYPELARCVGRVAARLGCHLLTGGGGGVMEESSRAFCEVSAREGLCIGILKGTTCPGSDDTGTALVHRFSSPNDWVELPIHTHLPLSGSQGREHGSRNHINVLTSDVLVALPGGSGTYSEVTLRIDYGKEVILFLGDGDIHGHGEEHFRLRSQHSHQVSIARPADELESLLSQALGLKLTTPQRDISGQYLDNDPLKQSFVFPSITGKSVLIVGVGGGCDIISAFALAEMLRSHGPARLVYANTKTKIRERLKRRSAHILELPGERITLSPALHTHGTTLIDQSVPRGADGCPLILLLEEEESQRAQLADEIREMSFDMIFSVDTGADSIVQEATSGPRGRDQRMMDALASVGSPWVHVIVGPGCDGETTFSQLQSAVRELQFTNRYLGCFSIEPLLPTLRELAAPLKRKRTPNIIADACAGSLHVGADGSSLVVPRGIRPEIPKRWLSVALVVRPTAMEAQPAAGGDA